VIGAKIRGNADDLEVNVFLEWVVGRDIADTP